MREPELQKIMETLKVAAQALVQGGDSAEAQQAALAQVSLLLSKEHLTSSVGGLTPVEVSPEEYFRQALEAVERAGVAIAEERTRVRVHLEIGEILYILGSWDEALKRFDEALALSEQASYAEGKAGALQRIGRLKRRRGHWQSAKDALNRALKIYRGLEDTSGEAEILLNLGNIAFEQGNYEEAEQRFQEALATSEDLKSEVMMGNINLSLGTIHQVRGQLEQALSRYTSSLSHYTASKDRRRMGQAYFNLGVTQRDRREWVQSGMSYERSLDLARETRDLSLLGLVYLRRAETQVRLSDATMAMAYGRKAMRVFVRLGDPLSQADAYRLYGRVAGMKQAWNQAEGFLTESRRLQQEYGCQLGEAEVIEEWGWLYEQMGERTNAIAHYREALSRYQGLGAAENVRRVQEMLLRLEENSAVL